MALSVFLPYAAPAGVFSVLANKAYAQATVSSELNSQKLSLGHVAMGPGGSTGALIEQIDDPTTLTPLMGPSGSVADIIDHPQVGGDITFYTVRRGDTVASVAELFGVTPETIKTANNLSSNKLKVDQTLVILPTSGVQHSVKKGETLLAIAKKYGVSVDDILFFNDMSSDDVIVAGRTLLVPVENFKGLPKEAPKKSSPAPKTSSQNLAQTSTSTSKQNLGKFILRPVALDQSIRTQGAHGYAGGSVDLGAKLGSPVVAAHDGMVVLAKSTGYNYGYGKYIIIMTEYQGQKVQTIYAHLNAVEVAPGQTVARGERIGQVGSTGNSTGPHLHFEVRGALNPLTVDRNYTGL